LEIPAYEALRAGSDFFGPHLYCLQGITRRGHTFSRHSSTPPDLLQEPFTGSATGGMAAYLWRYGLIDEPEFIAEQGRWLGCPSQGTAECLQAFLLKRNTQGHRIFTAHGSARLEFLR